MLYDNDMKETLFREYLSVSNKVFEFCYWSKASLAFLLVFLSCVRRYGQASGKPEQTTLDGIGIYKKLVSAALWYLPNGSPYYYGYCNFLADFDSELSN
jgi:hypothetical protein